MPSSVFSDGDLKGASCHPSWEVLKCSYSCSPSQWNNCSVLEQAFNHGLWCKSGGHVLSTETSWENKGMAVTGRALLLEFTAKN